MLKFYTEYLTVWFGIYKMFHSEKWNRIVKWIEKLKSYQVS